MHPVIWFLLVISGVILGWLVGIIIRQMPPAWLLDYGETEITDTLLQQKNLALWPDRILICLAEAVLIPMLFLAADQTLPTLLTVLACQPLLLILVADQKTRIIPDQFLIALLPFALLFYLNDVFTGSENWLTGLLQRLGGGLAGSLFLWLSGFIAAKIMKKEAMGMGDVKMLFVAGLLVGLASLPALLILSFLTAAFLALPLLIHSRKNHDADTEMAFGPFIALATILVMGFRQQIDWIWQMYLDLLIH